MPPSGPPPASARPMRGRRARSFPPRRGRCGSAAPDIGLSPLGSFAPTVARSRRILLRYFDFLPVRLTLRTVREARALIVRLFACLRGFGAAALAANAGILTRGSAEAAVSARRLAVASALARATRQSEVAIATEDSTRPPMT